VDGNVESEELNKAFIVTEAKEGSKIVGVILSDIDGWQFTGAENIAVNATGNVRKLGDPSEQVKSRPTS
jgi:hypothetical protein